jgi:tetratricopeptide (TPR) repeat protein
MHPFIRSFSLACLATLAAGAAQAEPGILWVKVLNLKNTPVRKVSIGTEGPGSSALTDDRGLARIRLAPQTNPGTWVTLEVSSGNYSFVSPWNRKVLIPSFENESENFVPIYLTARGDREALESGRFAVALAAKFNATLRPKLKDERTTEEERKAALAEVARSYGLTPEEADRAIREWSRKAVDPYDKGEIALYQQNYPEAMAQLSRSYEMRKPAFEKALAELVDVTFSLGLSLHEQGRYREAVEKLREANALRNDDFGINIYLGIALHRAGHYAEAEPPLSRALAISEKSLGADHLGTAVSLLFLADLYLTQGKYAEAEPLSKRALSIWEKTHGADHSLTGKSLDNLAVLYASQGKYAEAEPLFKRALAISEKALGPDHPSTAARLSNLAELYRTQGKYAEAEPLFKRELAISEKTFGADHPETASSLNSLAGLYESQGKYAEAEPLFKRALAVREKTLSADHPDTATSLDNLAGLYKSQSKFAESEPLFKRALAIREKALGADHPNVATFLVKYAELLRKLSREAEAVKLEARAKEIRAKAGKK